MKTFIFYTGITCFVIGLFGGFEFLAQKTEMKGINTMSRDQAMLLFGWTWILMGIL